MRLAVLEQLVGLGIIERQLLEIHLVARRLLDVLDGVIEQGERAQPQEVHLQKTDALDLLHRPLRGDFALVLLALVQRREFCDGPGRDHDAGRVHRGMAGHALETPGDLQELPDALVGLLQLGELRHLGERRVQRHVQRGRNHLGDAVHFRDRHLHDPADVTHHGARLHGAERDDLGHVLAAVLRRDVRDDFPAPPLAEVDIDIGQRHALGVQEPLEVQIEVQRDRRP